MKSKIKKVSLNNDLRKYANREISLGRAAELAKLSLSDFMKLAKERNIHLNYSISFLREDFNAAIRHSKL